MDELLDAPIITESQKLQLDTKQLQGLLTRNDKLALKKYWLMKKFHLQPQQFTMEFLLHWYGKEHILDNLLYALGKKTILNPQDPLFNKIPQKIQYLNTVLTVYGFVNLFDTEIKQKDQSMEIRMKESGLLDTKNYEQLMVCFDRKIRSKEKGVFSVNKYSILADMIFNEFGFTLKSQKKRTREGDQFGYSIYYWLEESRCNIKYFLGIST